MFVKKYRTLTFGLIASLSLIMAVLLLTAFTDGPTETSSISELTNSDLSTSAIESAARRYSPDAAQWLDAQDAAAAERFSAAIESAARHFSPDAARWLDAQDAAQNFNAAVADAAYNYSPPAAAWLAG